MGRMAKDTGPQRVRRSFTDEFKAGAVRLVLDEGRTVSQVGRDLDVSQSVVGNWVKQARADRSNGKPGLTTEERSELVKLRRENRELRLQRDLLKKVAVSSARSGPPWGGARLGLATVRVTFGGALAMAVTAAIGRAFGVSAG